MQTCVIFNPSARGRKAEAFHSRLGSLCPGCLVRLTGGQGHARLMAAQAVRDGIPTIVAVGGDGTANEVVNGIADVPHGLAFARLGIIPLGTVNVFARELGIPLDLSGAARVLAAGRDMAMDLARAEFTSGKPPRCRHFLQLAGAGLDARAVELVSWELKKRTGPLAYLAAGLKALREQQTLITIEGTHQDSGQLALIGNGRFYGGSLRFFPQASLRDGLLDVCVLPEATLWRALQGALGIASGKVHRFWPVRRFQSHALTLKSAARAGLQLDGEFAGELPVTISVLPQALRVIVP